MHAFMVAHAHTCMRLFTHVIIIITLTLTTTICQL